MIRFHNEYDLSSVWPDWCISCSKHTDVQNQLKSLVPVLSELLSAAMACIRTKRHPHGYLTVIRLICKMVHANFSAHGPLIDSLIASEKLSQLLSLLLGILQVSLLASASESHCGCTSVISFSKLNSVLFGWFDPINTILNNRNKSFVGLRNTFQLSKDTAVHGLPVILF